jgi:hypothetical protein
MSSYVLDEYGNLINERDESPAVFNTIRNIPGGNNVEIFRAIPISSGITRDITWQRGAVSPFTAARQQYHPVQVPPHVDEDCEILARQISEGYETLAAWKRDGDAAIAEWKRDVFEKIAAWKTTGRPRSEFPVLLAAPAFPAFPNMPALPTASKNCNTVAWNEEKRTAIHIWQRNKGRILTSWKDIIAETKIHHESKRRNTCVVQIGK